MEDNLKILKLTGQGHLLAIPSKGYNQPEHRKSYRTNNPVSFINYW